MYDKSILDLFFMNEFLSDGKTRSVTLKLKKLKLKKFKLFDIEYTVQLEKALTN